MPVVLIEARSSEVFATADLAKTYINGRLAVGRVGKPYHSWNIAPESDGYRAVLRYEPEEHIPPEEFEARKRVGQLPPLVAGEQFVVDSL